MKIPIVKLKAVIRYFCAYTDGRFLGKTKLMKLFYFLDFMSIKNYGAPITYDSYVNLEHGPIPSTIKNLVDTAADDIDNSVLADTIRFERPEGTNMCRVHSVRTFSKEDEKMFSKAELDILRRVCSRFSNSNTQQIEEASHKEAPWRLTRLCEYIPYNLAAKDNDCKFTEDELGMILDVLNDC